MARANTATCSGSIVNSTGGYSRPATEGSSDEPVAVAYARHQQGAQLLEGFEHPLPAALRHLGRSVGGQGVGIDQLPRRAPGLGRLFTQAASELEGRLARSSAHPSQARQ